MDRLYYRPVAMTDPARTAGALALAGGWCWFDRVEVMRRGGAGRLIAAADLPGPVRDRLTRPRPGLAGLALDRPRLMGILNVTPDSFSDGGRHDAPGAALAHARAMAGAGAALIDIGGESTRPGAAEVPAEAEIARILPPLAAIAAAGLGPVSVDTRKAAVARAALDAGAAMVNDVSALGFDPALAPLVAARGVPVCLMHARGEPATMQQDPQYDDVLLDVYDALAARIDAARAAGIAGEAIIADPGIGFGKTAAHNLRLLGGLSLFHARGVPVLLGASRKRFVGTIGGAAEPAARGPGSIAVTLAAIAQGVQIHRVHDVAEQAQAIRLWQAATPGMTP